MMLDSRNQVSKYMPKYFDIVWHDTK